MPRLKPGFVALALLYLAATLGVSAILPLRIAELNQALISLNFSWGTFMRGIAAIPGAVPLGYLAQLPLVLLSDHSRILLRLVSIFSALGNCYLIWRLARQTPVRAPIAAAAVFMLLPIHFMAASDAGPYELALLFLLLATMQFFKVLQQSDYRSAGIYAALLTLCIYTEPSSYLPAIGYVLFLLRFSSRPAERRALWLILPATALPTVLFVPFYTWANPQRNPRVLSTKLSFADADRWSQTLHGLAPGMNLTQFGIVLLVLLILGLCVGVWSSFPPFLWPLKMRINLFCLAGGSVFSILLVVGLAAAYRTALIPEHLLFASPGLVILTFAAIDWLVKLRPGYKPLAYALAASLLVLLGLPAVLDFASKPTADITHLVQTARQSLTPGSCIVFVSEGESPYRFLLYDSGIWKQECHNFFSKRVVLASHPWVRPDQQRDAELFFRGLNFTETRRLNVEGGVIIIEETR